LRATRGEVLPGSRLISSFLPAGWSTWAPVSVDRAESAMLVQELLDLSVPRVELFGPKNIGELADLFLQN